MTDLDRLINILMRVVGEPLTVTTLERLDALRLLTTYQHQLHVRGITSTRYHEYRDLLQRGITH